MEHYVTLFDSFFLPQGLSLHASMERHARPYTLWILCVDDVTHGILRELSLPNVRTISLPTVETAELARVKPLRSRGEYCWTLTPFAPKFVFDLDAAVQRVTYLDADTWLCRWPRIIFDDFELSGKAVLITEHAYAPEYDQTRTSGRFCVQFVTFVRDRSEHVRRWWADRCIEWCYARVEDGKFGDQMYLDDWPVRFARDVEVLSRRELMQAPWNSTRFAPSDAVIFHFHGLRLLRKGRVLLTDDYHLGRTTLEMIYTPYLSDLRGAVQRLQAVGFGVRVQIDKPVVVLWLQLLIRQIRLRLRRLVLFRFASLRP
jgi:hypothetical protein